MSDTDVEDEDLSAPPRRSKDVPPAAADGGTADGARSPQDIADWSPVGARQPTLKRKRSSSSHEPKRPTQERSKVEWSDAEESARAINLRLGKRKTTNHKANASGRRLPGTLSRHRQALNLSDYASSQSAN